MTILYLPSVWQSRSKLQRRPGTCRPGHVQSEARHSVAHGTTCEAHRQL